MKICMVGNSHVASLKNGWEMIKENFPDVEITFFAIHGNWMRGLEVSGDQLVSNRQTVRKSFEFTSGGLSFIQPKDYDNCFIYGLNLVVPRIDTRISEAVKSCSFDDAAFGSLNFATAQKFRRIYNGPVFVGHSPVLSFNTTDQKQVAEAVSDLMGYQSILSSLQQRFDSIDVLLVRQPQTTFDINQFTKSEYSQDAARLDRGLESKFENHTERNRDHMNAKFGALYLENWLASLLG